MKFKCLGGLGMATSIVNYTLMSVNLIQNEYLTNELMDYGNKEWWVLNSILIMLLLMQER